MAIDPATGNYKPVGDVIAGDVKEVKATQDYEIKEID
jgi:hypothetical protein